MARGLTASVLAEIANGSFRPVVFFSAAWADQTLYVWSGIGSVSWNGQTWLGVGDLGTISPNAEVVDVSAQGFTVTLAGANPAEVSEALAQAQRGLAGKAWLGFIDSSGNIVADPYLSCAGRLDQPTIDPNPPTMTLSLAYESRLVDLERPRVRRFNSADQQIDFPADRGFDFVPAIQEWSGNWGRA